MAGQVVVELTAQDKVSGVLTKINSAAANLQKNLGGATKRVGNNFKNLQSKAVNLQSVLSSLAVGAVVKGFVQAGVEADRTAKRLKFLGNEFGESAKLQQFANETAKKFTLGQTDAANAVGDLYGRLRPMGTSLDDIKTVFNGVNVAAKQMNLSTADTEGAMLQLSQALGSGTLQGDEFRSIMERLPKIGQAVAKSMGVTVDQLKDLSSKGKLTTKVIIKALKGLEKQGFPKADGVAAFNKAIKDLSAAIGQRLTPILDPTLKAIAGIVQSFLSLPKPVQAAVVAFGAVATAFAAITPLLPVIATGIGAIVAVLTGPVGIVAGIAAVVAAFVTMRGKAEEAKDPMKQVATEADKIKAATEAAARAKEQFIEKTKQHISALEEENSQIRAAEKVYENTIKITDARLDAEREIKNLQGQVLEQAYEQADSARERLGIAKQIYQNEVEIAKIAYEQTLNSIEAEQQQLEFRKQAAIIEAKIIQAKGELAAAQEKDADRTKLILEKTKNLVSAQEENVRMLDGQTKALSQIAILQKIAAEAVLQQKVNAAEYKLQQKLVSDEIGVSKKEAGNLTTNLKNSNTNAQNLATATDNVAANAQNSAHMFIRVATEAERAAGSINRAAAAQRSLNAAKANRSSGGGGSQVVQQAQGGYNLGSFQAFARGGVVTGPTLGLIGEGGEPEYIIPQSKAEGFAKNILAGARGPSAIPRMAEGGYAGPINISTGPVMQQDGTNYVTMAQFEAGIRDAADAITRSGRSYGSRRYMGVS